MSFFSKKSRKAPTHGTKIPPVGAWGHYNKKQGSKLPEHAVSTSAEALISVRSLTLCYEGRAVISGLSFDVMEGDYLSIIGENGSGKSTLMNAIVGLLKPTAGSIRFHDLARNQIGVLPQQMPVQNDFPATVREVVLAGCLARSNKGPFLAKDSKQIAFSNMEKLGITSLESRPFRTLSGGQRQRVLIARALCAAEKVLILDEPVTGLDPSSTADIYSLFRDLNKSGMTIITVTHDIRAALKYSNKLLRINKDRVFFGTVEEYASLPEADRYIDTEECSEDCDIPYGDGGFRYNGGDR